MNLMNMQELGALYREGKKLFFISVTQEGRFRLVKPCVDGQDALAIGVDDQWNDIPNSQGSGRIQFGQNERVSRITSP